MSMSPIMGLNVTYPQGPIVTGRLVTLGSMPTTANLAAFAARMNEICDDLGIPAEHGRQAALGRRFGVTPKAARKWLMGDGYPELELAIAIAEAAGVNINWLLQGAGPKRGDRIETKALVLNEAIEALPDEGRQQVLNFMGFTFQQADGIFTGERLARYMKMLDAFKAAPRKGAK